MTLKGWRRRPRKQLPDDWEQRRAIVLARDRHRCVECGSTHASKSSMSATSMTTSPRTCRRCAALTRKEHRATATSDLTDHGVGLRYVFLDAKADRARD
jgi:hypothetical protein